MARSKSTPVKEPTEYFPHSLHFKSPEARSTFRRALREVAEAQERSMPDVATQLITKERTRLRKERKVRKGRG